MRSTTTETAPGAEPMPDGNPVILADKTGKNGDSGRFVAIDVLSFGGKNGPSIALPPVRRWMALVRRNIYWMKPAFGKDYSKIPPETQFLLAEHENGRFSLALPLIDGDLRFSLSGAVDGVRVAADGELPALQPAVLAAYLAEGADPFRLIDSSIHSVARKLETFLPRREKSPPAFADHFGWCTWNAFYDRVDAAKIREGLESWKSKNLLPGLLILDDGWLDNSGDYLNDFAASTAAFPHGLSAVNRFLRKEYGIKVFGIWHAFQGYWAGINPEGPLAKRYRTVANRGKIRPWNGEDDKETDLFLVHPEEATRFYAEFYNILRSDGVDFVKVDGQSATEVFSQGVLGRVAVMKTFQQAFQSAGAREFGAEILHCMAHGNDVIWHCRTTNAMRSSDDYRPQDEEPQQQTHIQDNAYNSLFIGQIAVTDWDMFQSNRPHSAYHAAARAISGGPIYVSDEPGDQNEQLIEKLVWFDRGTARTLRCSTPALVTRDRIFVDCRREKRLLKLFNSANGIGLLGLFHTYEHPEPIIDSFSPSDVDGIEGTRFALWRHDAKTMHTAKREDLVRQSLPFMGWELITISPIQEGVAILGLLNKLNTPAGIAGISRISGGIALKVRDGGPVGLYCECQPRSVEADQHAVSFEYDAKSKLLVIRAPQRRQSLLEISWA